MTTQKHRDPIWNDYPIEELARRLDRSVLYLASIMTGQQPTRPAFRDRCVAKLNRPESDLFAQEETA